VKEQRQHPESPPDSMQRLTSLPRELPEAQELPVGDDKHEAQGGGKDQTGS